MNKLLRKFSIAGVLLAASLSVFAEESQTVEVVGAKIAPVPPAFEWIPSPFYADMHGTVASQQWLSQLRVLIPLANSIRDVRCVLANDMRTVTSQSNVLDRWLAASAVYNQINIAAQALKTVVIGTVKHPLDGTSYKAFQVVYADGGSEKWLIFPEPRSTVKLFDDPLPGSLIPSDGVLKPSPACGLG